MKKIEHNVPTHLKPLYNEFVDAANAANLLFESLQVDHGFSKLKGLETLHFDFKTSNGLTADEAIKIFGAFINKHPESGINYNLREQPSALEEALFKSSLTVMEISDGFKLDRI